MAASLVRLAYSERSLAFLETISAKLRRQIVTKVNTLLDDPYPSTCKRVQGMKDGEENVFRIRSGDYRILYVVRGNPHQIIVLDIDHRKDVYR